MFVEVAANGIPRLTLVTTKQFLKARTPGAYTACRTVNHRRRLLALDHHVDRLAESVRGLFPEAKSSPLLFSDTLKPKFVDVVRVGIDFYQKQNASAFSEDANHDEEELKIILSVCENPATKELFLDGYVSPLVTPKIDRCIVELCGVPRHAAEIKSAQWISDREPLEQRKSKDAEEIVLMDEDGRIYEGITSNFCVVTRDDNGAPMVITAPEHTILEGTVLHLVLRVCEEKLKLKTYREFPRIDNAEQGEWLGAFICSTSRLVLPVKEIRFIEKKREKVELATDMFTKLIRDKLQQSLEEYSTEI